MAACQISWQFEPCLTCGLINTAGDGARLRAFPGASFAPFACATCGWIALVPAWWVLTRSERVRRQPIRHGYLIGLIYFGGTFWWISNVTAIGTFFLVLYLALYPAVWFLLVARLDPRGRNDAGVLVQAWRRRRFG